MDDLGIYGSDENAMKAAAHDLKGLMRYSGTYHHPVLLPLDLWLTSCTHICDGTAQTDIAGLSVPLIQLIDYRGFRFVRVCARLARASC
jgi:hypothetical protein